MSKKPNYIIDFSKRNRNEETGIILNNEPLVFTNNCNYLGVTLDCSLNFRAHILGINSKISKNCGILFKIRDSLPLKARLSYYYGLIYPKLTYGIIVWGGTFTTHLDRLNKTHKRIVRTIKGAERLAHTSEIFYELRLLKLEDIFKYFLAIS